MVLVVKGRRIASSTTIYKFNAHTLCKLYKLYLTLSTLLVNENVEQKQNRRANEFYRVKKHKYNQDTSRKNYRIQKHDDWKSEVLEELNPSG